MTVVARQGGSPAGKKQKAAPEGCLKKNAIEEKP